MTPDNTTPSRELIELCDRLLNQEYGRPLGNYVNAAETIARALKSHLTTPPAPPDHGDSALEQLGIWPLLDAVDEGDGHSWVCHSTTDTALATIVWCQWCGVHQCELPDWTDDPQCPAFEAMSHLKQSALRRISAAPESQADVTDAWRKPPPHFKPDPHWQRQPQSDEEWDAHKDASGTREFRAKRRLAFAGDLADPRAPECMALVSRLDLSVVLSRLTWLEARFENTRDTALPPGAPPAARGAEGMPKEIEEIAKHVEIVKSRKWRWLNDDPFWLLESCITLLAFIRRQQGGEG